MIRITVSASAAAAASYHKSSLSKQGEYYKTKIKSYYHGKLAQSLGLHEVSDENFSELVNHINPLTKDRLTPLNKTRRRVGFDITTLPPKSFSILAEFLNDQDLINVFREANDLMMAEVERLIVAQKNTQTERFFEETMNGCWASFHHTVGRPVEHDYQGKTVLAGQMLRHVHNFLFNCSYSPSREKVLALDSNLIFRNAPYIQSFFHATLAKKVADLGYDVALTQDGWEIAGVSHLIDRFSERRNIIDRLAEEKQISSAKEKSKLGAKTRASKSKAIPEDQHFDVWKAQLTEKEFNDLQSLKHRSTGSTGKPLSPAEAIQKSLDHFLERNSVAEVKKEILAYALKITYGQHTPDDLHKALNEHDDILYDEDNHIQLLTTKEMVRYEDELISLCQKNTGKTRALNPDYQIKRDFLNEGQKKAVTDILHSYNDVIAIEGKAGSGKSTLLQELSDGLKASGKKLIPVAPSSQATDVLRGEGFSEASTIASFLLKPELQEQLRGQVLCVDEASMCGIPTMTKLVKLAQEKEAKIILAGNLSQHSSPGEFGDAFAIMQKQARIQTVHVSENMRQKPSDYKKAVDAASKGQIKRSYDILDKKLSAIHEVPEKQDLLKAIADQYVTSIDAKRSAIIVSPTHYDGDQITNRLRKTLKDRGHLKGEERQFPILKDLSLSEVEKQNITNYKPGHVLRFIRNQSGGFKAGSHHEIIGSDKVQNLQVRDVKTGQILSLDLQKTSQFSMYEKSTLPIRKGDLIKPTVNLKSVEGSKLNNSTPHKVAGFVGKDILLENGKTLPRDSYHFTHRYVSTSYAAQGATAQDSILSMSEDSLAGVNDKAYYVGISRGRQSLNIFTHSKDQLKAAIVKSGERKTAKEIEHNHNRRLQVQKQRAFFDKQMNEKQISNERSIHREKAPTWPVSPHI